MLIPFNNRHKTVIGATRMGKTYAVKKSLDKIKNGVLFFNTQHNDMPRNYIKANYNTEIAQLVMALYQGKKINYETNRVKEIRDKEISFIINNLFRYPQFNEKNHIFIVFDEVHLYGRKGKESVIEVYTTGIQNGLIGISISQRLALIDNTIVTQSEDIIIFKTKMEEQYFKSYGLPYLDIKNKLDNGGLFSYVIYNGLELKGAYRV